MDDNPIIPCVSFLSTKKVVYNFFVDKLLLWYIIKQKPEGIKHYDTEKSKKELC